MTTHTQLELFDYKQALIQEREDAAISAWEQCRDALPLQKHVIDTVFAHYINMFNDGHYGIADLYDILT